MIDGHDQQRGNRCAAGRPRAQWATMKDEELDYSWEREGEKTIYEIIDSAVIAAIMVIVSIPISKSR